MNSNFRKTHKDKAEHYVCEALVIKLGATHPLFATGLDSLARVHNQTHIDRQRDRKNLTRFLY